MRASPLIAIDQGEELFAVENAAESTRFLDMLGRVLSSPPGGLDPYVVITIRVDSVDALLQRVPQLGIAAPHIMPLPPLSPAAYRDVISKPAEVYSRQMTRLDLKPDLVEVLVEGATGADALPLLAFTLQRLFIDYAPEQDLTLAHYNAMGGIDGSIDRKLADAQSEAGATGTDENLRRLIVPGLATWDPKANAAKRLVADRAALVGGERTELAPLADALADARLLTRSRDKLEVAHEALLRRPPIEGWLEAQKDALKLRDDVLREANEWNDSGRHAENLVRRGDKLQTAADLSAREDFATALSPAKDYLADCRKLEFSGRRRARRTQAAIYTLMLGVIVALLGVVYKEPLDALRFEWTTHRAYIAENIRPHVLTEQQELKLKSGGSFRECAKACPEMVVIAPGSFRMGSPEGEPGRDKDEGPIRTVKIARPFAVSKFEVTWDDWEECVAMRGCDGQPTGDNGYGRGNKPVINVSWNQAKAYAAWLSRVTGKPYRLLSEAEWKYAARAGGQTVYSFGDDVSQICRHANLAERSYTRGGGTAKATDCNDGHVLTAPVGSFPANSFGLHDIHGNVSEWVQDCYVNYKDAPTDGSGKEQENCPSRVLRGGSWDNNPVLLRSANRGRIQTDSRDNDVGFRLARTL